MFVLTYDIIYFKSSYWMPIVLWIYFVEYFRLMIKITFYARFKCGHPTDDIQWCFCMPLIQAKCKHLWCSLISFKLVALVNTLIQYIEKMTSSKVENHKFLLLFLDFLTVSEIWFTFVRIKNKTFSVVVF